MLAWLLPMSSRIGCVPQNPARERAKEFLKIQQEAARTDSLSWSERGKRCSSEREREGRGGGREKTMHTSSPFMARQRKRTRVKAHAAKKYGTGATQGHGKQEIATVRTRAAPTSPAPPGAVAQEAAATTAPSPSVFVAALSPEELIREKQTEVMHSLTPWAETELLPMLKSPEKNWQPQDYLPDPSSEEFMDRIVEIRDRCDMRGFSCAQNGAFRAPYSCLLC